MALSIFSVIPLSTGTSMTRERERGYAGKLEEQSLAFEERYYDAYQDMDFPYFIHLRQELAIDSFAIKLVENQKGLKEKIKAALPMKLPLYSGFIIFEVHSNELESLPIAYMVVQSNL